MFFLQQTRLIDEEVDAKVMNDDNDDDDDDDDRSSVGSCGISSLNLKEEQRKN